MEKKLIINIGRQFGGGGLGVAHELGKRLGIPVYDRNVMALTEAEYIKSGKNTQKNCTKKIFTTQIITMV